MRRYKQILQIPGAKSAVALSMAQRLGLGAFATALTIFVVTTTGSYSAVGIILGSMTAGRALASVLKGRYSEIKGPALTQRVLTVLFTAFAAGLIVCVAAEQPVWQAALVAFAVGCTEPLGGALMRSLWGRWLPDKEELKTAMALEGVLSPIGYLLAPVLVTGGLISIGAQSTLIAAVAVQAGAAFLFSFHKGILRWQMDVQQQDALTTSRFFSWPLAWLLFVLFSVFLATAVNGLAILSVWEKAGMLDLAPMFGAVTTVGVVIGGAVFGARTWHGRLEGQLMRLTLAFAITLCLYPLLPSIWLLPVVGLAAGLLLGPIQPIIFTLAPNTVGDKWETAAQSALISVIGVSSTIGVALSGFLVQNYGDKTTLAIGAALAGLSLIGSVNLLRNKLLSV